MIELHITEIMHLCEVIDADVALLFDRTERTVRNWRRSDAPVWAKRALLAASGYFWFRLSSKSRTTGHWWRIKNGVVYTHEGDAFDIKKIAAIPNQDWLNKQIMAENRRLQEKLEHYGWAIGAANEGHLDQLAPVGKSHLVPKTAIEQPGKRRR